MQSCASVGDIFPYKFKKILNLRICHNFISENPSLQTLEILSFLFYAEDKVNALYVVYTDDVLWMCCI